MLSERSQSGKEKYYMIPFMRYPELSDSDRQKVKWWLPGAWGREKGESFNEDRVPLWEGKKSSGAARW